MDFLRRNQSMAVRKKYDLLNKTSDNAWRRICKPLLEDININTESLDNFPRFGPAYGKDTPAISLAKNQALDHVFRSQNSDADADEEDLMEYRSTYLSAIKKVEKEAWEAYDPAIVSNMRTHEFLNRMLDDGCFFLQLALSILGGSKQLGYHKQHMYFGSKTKNQESNTWKIRSMFFVGNQIPCVVINQLMKQSFFEKVITEKGKWNEPSDLPKRVLYELVVLPQLEKRNNGGRGDYSSSGLLGQKNVIDLLHGLECLVLGSQFNYPNIQFKKQVEDDHSDKDIDDDYSSSDDDNDINNEDDVKEDDAVEVDLEAGGVGEDLEQKLKFPSATELKQSGIRLRKTKGGIREISFKRKLFLFAFLYLPTFTLDDDTEVLLQYLTSYETGQQLKNNKREVSAYLRFMRDLIQTQTDVRILESKGIIEVKKKEHKDKLPEILKKLGGAKDVRLTQNLRTLRIDISDYSTPPWHLLSLAAIFTVVQTVFTVLSYFVPPNDK